MLDALTNIAVVFTMTKLPFPVCFDDVTSAERFPFFESDILLDDALHYVHHPTYERQQAWLGRKPRPPEPRPLSGSAHHDQPTLERRPRRSIVKQIGRVWKDGVVPYQLDSNLRLYHLYN